MSWTWPRSIVRDTSPEIVLTVSDATVTWTVSVNAPTSSAKSAPMRPSATRTKPAFDAFLNPWSSAATV